MDHLHALSPELFSRVQTLCKHFESKTKRIYIVGGAVRDLVMGAPLKDLDIEIFGIDPETFDREMQALGAKGCGKSFYVYKWHDIDLALPRKERKVAEGHRGFEVELAQDEQSASKRRDFCMNALMLNVFTGEMLDFWGGLNDLQYKQIRIIDEKTFQEDSLRVLRGIQFAARFGFKIERESIRVMSEMVLDDLSHERIVWEFEKLFHAGYWHHGWYYLCRLGVAQKLFNLDVSYRNFIAVARELMFAQNRVEEDNMPYAFIYILTGKLHLSPLFFPEALRLPNHYRKRLQRQKAIPQNLTPCFLLALAVHYPIREWLGNYVKGVKEEAVKMGIWNQIFDGNVTSQSVIDAGFMGQEIGLELRRRKLEAIRKRCRESYA